MPPPKKNHVLTHIRAPRSCAHIPAHARQHAAHDLPPPLLLLLPRQPLLLNHQQYIARIFTLKQPQTGGRDP